MGAVMASGTENEIRERLVRLETKLDLHVEQARARDKTLDELHDFLNQAKGAKWGILGVGAFVGSITGWVGSHFPNISHIVK